MFSHKLVLRGDSLALEAAGETASPERFYGGSGDEDPHGAPTICISSQISVMNNNSVKVKNTNKSALPTKNQACLLF